MILLLLAGMTSDTSKTGTAVVSLCAVGVVIHYDRLFQIPMCRH